MDIFPEDFDPAYRARLQQVRHALPNTRGLYSFVGSAVGFTIACCLEMWRLNIDPNMSSALYFAGGPTGIALGYACGLLPDRKYSRKQITKQVTAQEITLITKGERDPLRTEYLGLASELVSMRPFQDTSAESSLRDAFRGIGASVEKLPEQPADDLLLDAGTFKVEASRLAVEAAQESDPVVAASLERQSAAQNQRAEAIGRNAALVRRNQVLRREMTGHIKALKTMIGASALGEGGEGYDLAALAENVQQVANEARSLTEAQTELAAALGLGHDSRKNVTPEQPQFQGLNGQSS